MSKITEAEITKLKRLSRRIAELQTEFYVLKSQIKQRCPLGTSEGISLTNRRRVKVRTHYREAHTVLRVTI